jgi:periplasmic mercuric ion binding protein
MKYIKLVLLFAIIMFVQTNLFAQTDTVQIKTSAICDECKERIENDLSFEKGVKSAKLNLETKEVMVVFNPNKTTAAKIAEAITKIGYDADSLKADAKAFKKLPECCQRPMH